MPSYDDLVTELREPTMDEYKNNPEAEGFSFRGSISPPHGKSSLAGSRSKTRAVGPQVV